jgi:hypothetical protein
MNVRHRKPVVHRLQQPIDGEDVVLVLRSVQVETLTE